MPDTMQVCLCGDAPNMATDMLLGYSDVLYRAACACGKASQKWSTSGLEAQLLWNESV